MTTEEKEQTNQSSTEKTGEFSQSSTEKTEESSKIGSMKDAMEKYEEKTRASSEEKPEAKEEKPSETPEEDELWLVDKAGNKTPAVFKADGKEYRPKEVAKALQYMSLGVHGNVKTEELNRKLAEVEKAEPFLKMIKEAYDGGRLVVDGKRVGEKETKGEEEEEDIFEDEEAKKNREKMEALEKDVSEMKKEKAKSTIEKYKTEIAGEVLDKIKGLGFAFATKSGISMGLNDLKVPKDKSKLVSKSEQKEELIRKQYQQGLLSKQERRARIIEVWNRAKQEISNIIPETLDIHGPVYNIFNSG
ncbi:MAG: hypothetical protein U9Q97_05505, partial [Acidobacteriota bacterium]|nr:hypothetical protein [Acidobacteriota bacterium]